MKNGAVVAHLLVARISHSVHPFDVRVLVVIHLCRQKASETGREYSIGFLAGATSEEYHLLAKNLRTTQDLLAASKLLDVRARNCRARALRDPRPAKHCAIAIFSTDLTCLSSAAFGRWVW